MTQEELDAQKNPFGPKPAAVSGQTTLGETAAPTGSLGWNSGAPGDVYYTPEGGEQQLLTPEALGNDPMAMQLLQQSAGGTPNPATTAYKTLLEQSGAPPAESGSSHSLAPEVVNKMWR